MTEHFLNQPGGLAFYGAIVHFKYLSLCVIKDINSFFTCIHTFGSPDVIRMCIALQ